MFCFLRGVLLPVCGLILGGLASARLNASCGATETRVVRYESLTRETSLVGISGYRPTGNTQAPDDPTAPWNVGPVWKWRKRALSGTHVYRWYDDFACVPDDDRWEIHYSGEYVPSEDQEAEYEWIYFGYDGEPEEWDNGYVRDIPFSSDSACGGSFSGIYLQTTQTLTSRVTVGCGCLGEGAGYSIYDTGSMTATLLEPDSLEDAWGRAISLPGGMRRAFGGKMPLTTPESVAPLPLVERSVRVVLQACSKAGPFKMKVPYRIGNLGDYEPNVEASYSSTPDFDEDGELVFENFYFDEKGEFSFELPIFEGKITELLSEVFELVPAKARAGSCGTSSCSAPGMGLGVGSSAGASMRFAMDLGALSDGTSAGILRISEAELGDGSYTPSALQLIGFSSEVVELRDGLGALRQVVVPEALVDIVTISPESYRVAFYMSENVGSLDPISGVRSTTGDPFVTYTIAEPSGSVLGDRRLSVVESRGAKNIETTYRQSGGLWEVVQGNGLRLERLYVATDSNGDTLETRECRNSDATLVWKQIRRLRAYPFGDGELEVVEGDGAVTRVLSRSYYDNVLVDGAAYGKVKRELSSTGFWVDWHYDSNGRVAKKVSQFLSTTPGSTDNLNRVTEWVYSAIADIDGDGVDEAIEAEVDYVLGQEVGRRYKVELSKQGGAENPWKEIRYIVATTPGATWDASSNMVTIVREGLAGVLQHRELWRVDPDGLVTSLELEFLPSGGRKWITRSGIVVVDDIVGRREEVTEDALGREILREVYESGVLVESSEVVEMDDHGRATLTLFLDGSEERRVYACCGLAEFRGRDGILNTYAYDDLGRLVSEAASGVARLHAYDAMGRRTKTTRVGSDDSEITMSETAYDVLGRVVATTDACGRVTEFETIITSEGMTEEHTIYSDGGEIRRYYPDGSLLSVEGAATIWRRYAYGVDIDGFYEQEYLPRGDEGSSPVAEWVKRYRDHAGRIYLVRYPDSSEKRFVYNSLGQLDSRVDPDGVRTLYAYGRGISPGGHLEEWTVEAIDRSGPNVINYSGSGATADRIIRTRSGIALKGTVPVYRTITERWLGDGDNPVEILKSERTANGLSRWDTSHGETTQTVISRDGLGGEVWTVSSPNNTHKVSTYLNGRLVAELGGPAGATEVDPRVAKVSYVYDEHGRQIGVSQLGGGATAYTYYDDDQVESVTTSDPGTGSQTTSYTYNDRGWVASVAYPDAEVKYTTYYPSGRVKREWGAGIYPVEYTYDAQGRIKTMTTWQNFAGTAGEAVTTWSYHAQRGWLMGKRYADNKGPDYTYTPAGRLLTRTWARTVGGSPVVATYGYNDAGDLESIDYSDTTPSVAYTYDRAGRVLTTSDAAGLLTRSYDGISGLVSAEVYSGAGALAGRSLTRTYDARHRPQSVVTDGGHGVNYGYDTAGRLDSVSQGFHQAVYDYKPHLGVVESVSIKRVGVERVTHTRQIDVLGRTTRVQSASGSAVHIQRDYTYNAANQRVNVQLEDTRRWAYDYDDLGQVTFAQKRLADNSTPLPGYSFGYTFDDIGNRTQTVINSRATTYTADLLNRYTSRQVAGAVDVRGEADEDATVTVNALSTIRTGRDFYREMNFSNSSAAVSDTVTIEAVRAGPPPETASEARAVFLAQTPEAFAYDDDGNLTQDGRWDYRYDAENRLWQMETKASIAVLYPELKKRLTFTYDSQGRRVRKLVETWNAGGGNWETTTDLRFLYDGWNLLAELNALDGHVPVRSYVWGLDLGGNLQGAGGVGGLLWANTPTHSFAASHDANGNIVAYINTASLAVSGRADYGAFGERVQVTGVAATLPFGFSTKYTDAETGLLYYGFRYYNPSTGRWPSRDPIEERGGVNLYGMIGNDAVNGWDYLGLDGPFGTAFSKTKCKIVKEELDGAWASLSLDYNVSGLSNGFGMLDSVRVTYRVAVKVTCECVCPLIIGTKTTSPVENHHKRLSKTLPIMEDSQGGPIVGFPNNLPASGRPTGTLGDILSTLFGGSFMANAPVLTDSQRALVNSAIQANLPTGLEGEYERTPCEDR